MALALVGCGFALMCGAIGMGLWRTKVRHDVERRFITPEELHALMSQRKILIFDVRQPLDLLGESEVISGAKWISPYELIKNPALIPKDETLSFTAPVRATRAGSRCCVER